MNGVALVLVALSQDPLAEVRDEIRRLREENAQLHERLGQLERQTTENARTIHRLRQAIKLSAAAPAPDTPLSLPPPSRGLAEPRTEYRPPPPPLPAGPKSDTEEADRLLKLATPLYQDLARRMEDPPSEATALRSVLASAKEAERHLVDAQARYVGAAAGNPALDGRARAIGELLVPLRASIRDIEGMLK